MKKLYIIIVLMIAACGGGEDSLKLTPPAYSSTVSDTTIMGESHAALFPCDGFPGTCENNGICGAPIEWLLQFPDTRKLKRVILFTGFNTLKTNTVSHTVTQYARLFWNIRSENVYCVGLPTTTTRMAEVREFNSIIRGLCGADHYVDSWDLTGDAEGRWYPGMTTDGGHLSDAAYRVIIAEIQQREER